MSEEQPGGATAPPTDAGEWTELGNFADLAEGAGQYLEVKKHGLAVFRQGEGVHIICDTCPHAGGSLASGWVRDGVVFCPWHAWPFRLDNGECPDNPSIKVRRYETRIVEGKVQVKL